VFSAFEDNDFCILIEPASARCGAHSGGNATDDDDSHSALSEDTANLTK
jgi:hypothetical protein